MSKLHAIKDALIQIILDQHASTKNSGTPTLEPLQPEILNTELTRLIDEATKENDTDRSLLTCLRNVSVLLNQFTHGNTFLDEAQQSYVKKVLVELFTALNTLCETSQTSVYTSTSGIICHGFLNSDGAYSPIGEQISTRLKLLWNLEQTKAVIDQIDDTEDANADGLIRSKVDELLQDYQKEVKPAHLQAVIGRLTVELNEKNSMIAELRRKIAAMQPKLTTAPSPATVPTTTRREPNQEQAMAFPPMFSYYNRRPVTPARTYANTATQTDAESPDESQYASKGCVQQ